MSDGIIHVNSREQIRDSRRSIIPIGTAADGLPLLLFVDRGESLENLLIPIASRLGYDNGDEYAGTPFSDIVSQLEEIFNNRDIKLVDTERGKLECYITSHKIRDIVGPTILERIFGAKYMSPTTAIRSSDSDEKAEEDTRDKLPESKEQQIPVRAEVGNLRLSLPLDDSSAITVRCIERPKHEAAFRYSRVFEPESLTSLETVKLYTVVKGTNIGTLCGSIDDRSSYLRIMRKYLEGEYKNICCRIAKTETASIVMKLAVELRKLHEVGEIHGDVKPSNALITSNISPNSVCAIDSLRLKQGFKSPAMTRGWAAPEQILGVEVNFPTDQYPIGLMLCRLLGGVLYGEESTFIIPTGGMNIERFTLLRNPGVYLDPDTAPVGYDGIYPWRRLIERCLKFNSGDRFPDMSELVNELQGVISRHPLQGESEFELNFGALVIAQFEGSVTSPVWLTKDIRY